MLILHSKEHLLKDVLKDKEHIIHKAGKLITRAEEVAEDADFLKFHKKHGKKFGKIFGERDVEDLGDLQKALDEKKKAEAVLEAELAALVGVSIANPLPKPPNVKY